MFKLLDYFNQLILVKETPGQIRFICPNCQQKTLTLNKRSDAYQCWGGCTSSEIKAALNVVVPSVPRKVLRVKVEHPHVSPVPIKLKRIGTYEPSESIFTDHLETYYRYDDKRKVVGHRYGVKGSPGYWKKFFPFHGYVKGRGEGSWCPYRIKEALENEGSTVLWVEGESCVDLCLSIGFCAITVQQWSHQEILFAFQILKEAGISVLYIPDNDKTGQKKEELVSSVGRELGVYVGVLPIKELSPDIREGGDIGDIIQVNPEYVRRRLESMEQVEPEIDQKLLVDLDPSTAVGQEWAATCYLMHSLKKNLVWTGQSWMLYEGGKFVPKPPEFVRGRIIQVLKMTDFNLSKNLVESCLYMLQGQLSVSGEWWEKGTRYAVFPNRTVDLKTLKFVNHSPYHCATTGAIFPIEARVRETGIIVDWLKDCVAEEDLNWLRAFFSCVIRNDTHYEKYLELVGPGGCGKSTVTRMLAAMVGPEGSISSSLDLLDRDKFEVACLHGKRLLMLPDQNRYHGNYSVLKAITGHDSLRYEVKGVQRNGNDFYARINVIATANEPLNGSDLTSGIQRRRRVIGMSRAQKHEDSLYDRKGQGILAPGMSDFWWWCITMPQEDVKSEMTKDLIVDETLSDSPILSWALQRLERKTNSVSNRELVQILYKDYVDWCQKLTIPIEKFTRFNFLLIDTLQSQLCWAVTQGRTTSGPFIQGIQIKEKKDG